MRSWMGTYPSLDDLCVSSVGLELMELIDKVLCNWGRFRIALFLGSFPLSLRGYENEPGYEARFGTVPGIKPLDHMLAAYCLTIMLVAVNHLSTTKHLCNI